MINRYRITLFSSTFKDEIITFDFPLLPNTGEIIEVDDEELFIIKERSFSPWVKDGLICITLYGAMENDDLDISTPLQFERLKNRLKNNYPRTIPDIPILDLDE